VRPIQPLSHFSVGRIIAHSIAPRTSTRCMWVDAAHQKSTKSRLINTGPHDFQAHNPYKTRNSGWHTFCFNRHKTFTNGG
ncbi:MAG TPA: hypothetical protein VFV28_04140, partial [Limnobacter sp.]|nr:hypothetical protein [Limnobacter sp.]